MKKHYVEMICHIDTAGEPSPTRIIWPDGRSWGINCVLQTSTSPFGEYEGTRYIVLIGNLVKNIYEDGGRWYVLSEE